MESWADFQRQEDGLPPAALVFDGAYIAENYPNGMDEDEIASMNLAMERDMESRENFWMRRALDAEARLREIEGDCDDDYMDYGD